MAGAWRGARLRLPAPHAPRQGSCGGLFAGVSSALRGGGGLCRGVARSPIVGFSCVRRACPAFRSSLAPVLRTRSARLLLSRVREAAGAGIAARREKGIVSAPTVLRGHVRLEGDDSERRRR